MDALVWALVGVPLACGGALLCSGPTCAGRAADRMAPLLAILAAAATLALAIAAAAQRPAGRAPLLTGIDLALAVDGLSAIMVVTVAAVTLAVLVFSAAEFGPDEPRARFAGLMLVFAGAMLVTVTATGLAPLLMGWELMGATSWALIGFWWREPRRVQAANVAFLTTRAADLGLYLAAGAALAGGVATLELARLPGAEGRWLDALTAGIVLASIGKSAQLPLHFWLSRAMEGPSPVSALLHSATMVAAGAYLLLRVEPLLGASPWAGPLVAWLGAATAVVLGLVAVAQSDLKQLLAASTSAQVGFMVLAAGTGGVAAGSTALVAHAATKSALFLAAGAWLSALGTKSLAGLRGAARRHPVVGATFTVAAGSLAGLPPLSLWAAKDEVLASARAYSVPLYLAGLAGAVISAIYSAKAAAYVWAPEPGVPGWDTEERGTRRVGTAAGAALVALAGAAAVLGVLGLPPVAEQIRDAVGEDGAPSAASWELALSGALAAAAAGLAWWWGDRPLPLPAGVKAVTADWLRVERLAVVLVVRPTMGLARALARFDDWVLDRAVTATPRAVGAAARALARFDHGGLDRAVTWSADGTLRLARFAQRRSEFSLDGAVRAVAAGARWLGRAARRPQTGQLHQYYAQAAAAFAGLAVLVVLVR